MHPIHPSWFLVGAEKAGTSSAYEYLRQHPQLLLPPPKEPHFYSHRLDHANYRGHAQLASEHARYLAPYQSTRQVLAGDCSTSYLHHPCATERIHNHCPDARILVLLRDPVDRAWSHFLMNRRMEGARSFAEIHRNHEWVRHGLYGEQLERYIDVFGREQVFVQYTEDFAQDPSAVLARFARHLRVNPESVQHIDTSTRHNRFAGVPKIVENRVLVAAARRCLPQVVRDHVGAALTRPRRRPEMNSAMREKLQGWFLEDIGRLQDLGVLDQPLPWAWATCSGVVQ